MPADDEGKVFTDEEVKMLLESQDAQGAMDKIKVLVVEDDHSTQLLYKKGLFDEIFDKRMVVSGKEAISVYDEWHPDIIVLDIYLPEMTGYQVLKTIRSGIGDTTTSIIMATALSSSDDVLSCMKLGIEGYIVKPFSLGEIGSKILRYYEKKEPERARKGEALFQEILKKHRIKFLLDKDRPKKKVADEAAVKDGAAETKTAEGAGDTAPEAKTPEGTGDASSEIKKESSEKEF